MTFTRLAATAGVTGRQSWSREAADCVACLPLPGLSSSGANRERLELRQKRPPALSITSLAQLYRDFERLFLRGAETQCDVRAASGHTIVVYDHNFFHLVKLNEGNRLHMPDEKPRIRAQTNGFGDYRLAEGGRRAQHLPSAFDTLTNPDGVLRRSDLRNATHVFYKKYDHGRYPFTVVLMHQNTGPAENPVLTLRTSYPCNKRTGERLCEIRRGVAEIIWRARPKKSP